ncbi:hypothetical protein DJ84_18235 [Halorubrum ezzemoulense]|nr:hypothetical protein DJ84_18235 [Halorubrum ezzemoulense]
MSSVDISELPADDRVSLTEAVYDAIETVANEDGNAPVADVIDLARKDIPQTARDVHDRLERLNRHGEVYKFEPDSDGQRVAITDPGGRR